MGRHSDSDVEDYSRSKKKKKKASRSRSCSSEDSRASKRSKAKKSKKSKHKKRSRSRSRSPDRSHRSHRKSRSRSRGRRSRSKDRRRSRSRDRGRRSRSRSKSRRSRSRSRTRRSTSRSRRRSRSRSRGRKSRSRSPRRDRSRDRSRRSSPDKWKEETKTANDPCASIPGFADLPASQQAEIRLQMALKAAAAADEKLKEQGLLNKSSSRETLSYEDQRKRADAIQDIEAPGFAPGNFKSSRNEGFGEVTLDSSHENAIFGTGDIFTATSIKPIQIKDGDNLMHPNLYVSAEEKMDHWIQKLTAMRKRKLEGEAMS